MYFSVQLKRKLGDNMKENRFIIWIRKHLVCSIVIALLLFIVGIPILINLCYSCDHVLYVTKWGAEDVLAYYGTVMGASIAVATIAVTISFNRKQIQRADYIKRENDKWKAIESEIANALDRINPQRVFAAGIDCLSAPNDNFGFIISSFQKYQLDCRITTDKLISLLSTEDYPRVDELFQEIRHTADILFDICDEERKTYEKIRDLKARDSMLQVFELEKRKPNSFSKEDLEYCAKVLKNTDNVQYDNLWESIGTFNQALVNTYTDSYRNLLALKIDTFNVIYEEIKENADELLHFRRIK